MFKQTTTIIFFFMVLFIFLVLVRVFNISYPVMVMQTNKSTELSVVGEGKVDVVPDTAHIDVGVNIANATTVEAAQSQITKTNNAVIAAMKKLGIAKENIKTSNYSIYPAYDYTAGRGDTITGYTGNVTISIKTKNIAQVSQVIEESTKAGANQVQGTRFEVEDPDKYRKEARDEAIKNAKTQAQQLADSLGIKLGKVVNIVEYSGGSSSPIMPYAAEMSAKGMGGGGGPSIEPGSQTITSVVTLYFEKR
jgi:hypothetical protein